MVDDRSPNAKAFAIVSQIMTVILCAILPLMVGYGIDQWLGSKPWLTIVLGAFGVIAAGVQFMKLAKPPGTNGNSGSQS